ncbi:hypothetical protein K470DRAFT_206122, partial [Piedraia hortae CBS 480.64]
RPYLTISILGNAHQYDREVIAYDVSHDLTLDDLKTFIHAEIDVPPERQQFWYHNQAVRDTTITLGTLGIQDEDIIGLQIVDAPVGQQQAPARQQPRPTQGTGPFHRPQGADEIEATRRGLIANPDSLRQIQHYMPSLANEINDPMRFREVWMERVHIESNLANEMEEQARILNEDPF